MRCGKAKKILFSGCRYDDLSPAIREDLTRHMEKCGDCREIEKNIREIATEPFARAQAFLIRFLIGQRACIFSENPFLQPPRQRRF